MNLYQDTTVAPWPFLAAVKEILPSLPQSMRLFCIGRMVSPDLMPTHLDQLLNKASVYPPPLTEQTFRGKQTESVHLFGGLELSVCA